ncbi:hypothetical protein V1507DRAFT_450187 [Lipomyces tetrasporus]
MSSRENSANLRYILSAFMVSTVGTGGAVRLAKNSVRFLPPGIFVFQLGFLFCPGEFSLHRCPNACSFR